MNNTKILNFIWLQVNNLPCTAMTLLAINRFCFLYNQRVYKKVFTRWGMLAMVMVFDIFFGANILVRSYYRNYHFVFLSLIFLFELGVSLLVYLKIRTMKNLAANFNVDKLTLKDLRRSTILLLLHSCLFFIFVLVSILSKIISIAIPTGYATIFFVRANMFFIYFEIISYQVLVIVNGITSILYLKAYQRTIKGVVRGILMNFNVVVKVSGATTIVNTQTRFWANKTMN